MKKFWIGISLGAVVMLALNYFTGVLPDKSSKRGGGQKDFELHELNNRSLIYWNKDHSYKIYLYGDIALIGSVKEGSPPFVECNFDEAKSVFDRFERLPNLESHKNPVTSTVLSRERYRTVFVQHGRFGPEVSYSIPDEEVQLDYLGWREQIDTLIQKYSNYMRKD